MYCVFGHNVSADAVATLRAAGWNAHALAGGMEGGEEGVDTPQDIAQWRGNAMPSMTKRPDWGVTGERASRWITRERPKIDRIACPWLIRRFIDPDARFLYVAPAEVLGVAGFDWILLDAEHAPNDVLSLIPQLMALKDSASAPVVRAHEGMR